MMNEPKPFAWVLPGDDTARDDGFIDAMVIEQGEFTKPLYTASAFETLAAENAKLRAKLDRKLTKVQRLKLIGPDVRNAIAAMGEEQVLAIHDLTHQFFLARAALTQQGDQP
jgi:hypothetical protein